MVVLLLLLQLTATLLMTGLIWFVQIVHYPLFEEVGSSSLARYENLHARRTTWVVFPPMVVELITSGVWLYGPLRPAFVSAAMAWVLTGLVGVIWVTTGLGHVPLHTQIGKASSGPPDGLLRLLVRWNWVRRGACTARTAMLL